MRYRYTVLVLLLVLTAALYARTAAFEFISIDDPQYVLNNYRLQAGLTLDGVRWAFTSVYAANWHPVSWLSHMLDIQLYGMKPGGHHITSVLLHVANTFLLCFVFFRMTASFWRSLFVAALFALHPLHVESVAWVAERKDVLSTFLLLLAVLGYSWYAKSPSPTRYAATLVTFALGLMAKPMLVTLPFLLLLLDWWPLRRFDNEQEKPSVSRLVAEKIPFIILSIASSIITVYAQRAGGALVPSSIVPPVERLGGVFTDYVWYLWKTVWPVWLAFFYPIPLEVPTWQIVCSTALILGISIFMIIQGRNKPFLAVGWFWFLGTLIPVIGLVAVGMQDTADRYSYIPSIGLFIMLSWQAPEFLKERYFQQKLLAVAGCGILVALSFATWKQIGVWRNSLELGCHAVSVTKGNYMAHNMLADALDDAGRTAEAISHYEESLRIMPSYEIAHNSLGVALVKQGEISRGMEHFAAAVRLQPTYADAYVNMGASMANNGRYEEAVRYYREALRIDPEDISVVGYLNQAIEEIDKGSRKGSSSSKGTLP